MYVYIILWCTILCYYPTRAGELARCCGVLFRCWHKTNITCSLFTSRVVCVFQCWTNIPLYVISMLKDKSAIVCKLSCRLRACTIVLEEDNWLFRKRLRRPPVRLGDSPGCLACLSQSCGFDCRPRRTWTILPEVGSSECLKKHTWRAQKLTPIPAKTGFRSDPHWPWRGGPQKGIQPWNQSLKVTFRSLLGYLKEPFVHSPFAIPLFRASEIAQKGKRWGNVWGRPPSLAGTNPPTRELGDSKDTV